MKNLKIFMIFQVQVFPKNMENITIFHIIQDSKIRLKSIE